MKLRERLCKTTHNLQGHALKRRERLAQSQVRVIVSGDNDTIQRLNQILAPLTLQTYSRKQRLQGQTLFIRRADNLIGTTF